MFLAPLWHNEEATMCIELFDLWWWVPMLAHSFLLPEMVFHFYTWKNTKGCGVYYWYLEGEGGDLFWWYRSGRESFCGLCMMHNSILTEIEIKHNTIPVGHGGGGIAGDAIWIGVLWEGIAPHCVLNDKQAQALLCDKWHHLLAKHVKYLSWWAKKGTN